MSTTTAERLRVVLEALRAHAAMDREARASVALDNDPRLRTYRILPDTHCVTCAGEVATSDGDDRWCIKDCRAPQEEASR